MPQLSQSGREVLGICVSAGQVYWFRPGDTAPTLATNLSSNVPPLNISGLVYSAANIQKLWFADGVNAIYFDPSDKTVRDWTASAGQLPTDADGNRPRLICTWRGRTLQSGLFGDPHNIFGSAVGEPRNYDYAPAEPTPTQAFDLSLSNMGVIGDSVNSMCPYTDDVLIAFGDHSINLIRGDPMAGGRRDLVTNTIGAVWGKPWAMDPYGTIYFFSNKMGVYTLVPGAMPVRISQPIDNLLAAVDTGKHGITMVWDDAHQGCHLYITRLDVPAAATHYWYDWRSQAWFQKTFKNKDHNPLCTCILDGNLPEDRVVLLGSWDGFIRAESQNSPTDDGEAIESSVVIGPILTALFDEMIVKEVQAVLGNGSADVTYKVYAARTAELALAALVAGDEPQASGTWTADRNLNDLVRVAGHALYLELSSTDQWSMEGIRILVGTRGEVRRRGL